MPERLVAALGIESPELFSIRPSPAGTLRKLHEAVLKDFNGAAKGVIAEYIRKQVCPHQDFEHIRYPEPAGHHLIP
jgi:hypothetical protein